MACWSKDFTLKFIEKYRALECMWKIKTEEYRNRDMKEAAYGDLVALIKKVDKTADKNTVVKKINNLRSAFRKEVKKVQNTENSDDVYTPKLWYYNELLFLLDQEESGGQNLEESDQDEPTEPENSVCSPQPTAEHSRAEESPSPLPTTSNQRSDPQRSTITQVQPKFKRSRPLSPTDQILTSVGQWLTETKKDDHYDHFGRYVAQKIRFLDNGQRIIAEKLINDVLFEAELKTLHRNASIQPGSS